jgi:CRP/FNR family transcriptional regulator, cyclic AMP receptor protein
MNLDTGPLGLAAVILEANRMTNQAEFAVILQLNPMFADLGTGELQRLAGLCHTRQFEAGEFLFRKGDPGDALFGVRRGQIRIETGASNGGRLTLNFMGPGDLFGEVAVLDGQSRTADAIAGEPSELFVLRREDFLGFLEREPKVAIKLIMLLCQRIRWQSERMEESALQPLPVRLARRLCALASDFGSEVHISQEQLGVFVGAARESVNRQLQLWRKDGILDLQRGRILLQDMSKLTAVARNE